MCQVLGGSVWDPKDDPLSPEDHPHWCEEPAWTWGAWMLILLPQENTGKYTGQGDSPVL